MPLSLNNRKDIVADSISIDKGNETIDLADSLDAILGIAPDGLNSLKAVFSPIPAMVVSSV